MMQVIIDTIKNFLNIQNDIWAWLIFCVLGVLLTCLIILIIISICKSVKNKKQPEAVEEAAEEEKVEEEEAPAQEEKEEPEEEAKEEPKEEPKEEAKVVEDTMEEAYAGAYGGDFDWPDEDEEEEETEEKVEEEPKPKAKKAPAKKPTTTKKAPAKKKVEEKKAESKLQGKYIISEELDNYRYRLKAPNGELLVVSELYSTIESCRKGIDTVKRNLETATLEIFEDKHGLFSFRVMTKQGRCLATSANYKTKTRAQSASESFKRWAVTERIEEDDKHSDHFEVEEFNEEVEQEENGKFRITESPEGYTFQLFASNGRVIATSQTYRSALSCEDALENFRRLAYEGKFYIFKDKNNRYQFKLYNAQKRLILAGEVYEDKARAISVIESIKRFASKAEIVKE